MIRIVLADDQRLVRAGFRSILEDEDDLEVVGEAGDGAEALAACRALRPDVVLLDIRMPGVDGLQAARDIAADARLKDVRVVILTTFDLDDYVYGALRAGATGFLVKDTEPEELVHAVRVAARGDALISPSVTRRLIAEFAGRVRAPEPGPRLNALTDRESEVMRLVAAGLTNDEIAARLVLSPATAKTHVSRIMTKLDVRDRSQLVVLAYESGMVSPGWLTE
ncbi:MULTISPECIES: response regulator [Streptomyces]|uniref:Response regulator transcription factor n=1 Tax=Streptomyces rochei TaxID=1928 RepID=A0AAX3ZK84_STRRO|nr:MULTISPECIES: response regulator transcription factor [Streptomyces]WDI19271.1 response regulator transcription factor [Streptomyces enissocaesilis]NEC73737.1 response regulator transcription factor [Streptomyces rochei]QCR48311.1 DNA-binding response regulator [Streptomyces sp. SGAir0924]RSR96163.1 DNA-binding response regulator [Streptomyces sp. WAC04189]RSS26738.1 DNA-binding response regulator [Streptomyces sp. WAC05458]